MHWSRNNRSRSISRIRSGKETRQILSDSLVERDIRGVVGSRHICFIYLHGEVARF